MRLRYGLVMAGMFGAAVLAVCGLAHNAGAQTAGAPAAMKLVEPATLLPASFGIWKSTTGTVDAAEPAMSLVNANQAALEESSPVRSATAAFASGTRTMRVEAVEFKDATGAFSAYSLLRAPDLRDAKDLGTRDAVGDGAVIFTSGTVLVLAYPASADDVKALQGLEAVLPKAGRAAGLQPLLPTFLPEKAMQPGSVRYALGPATYAAQGGVLPASSLNWAKSAETVTAHYVDKRGDETLTLLLYPTPQIARAQEKQIEGQLASMGPKFATAKARQHLELVAVASGTFSADLAQQMIENINPKVQVSFDKAPPEEQFHQEIRQTYSMMTSIAILAGVLMLAAVVLGVFLGFGRATLRLLRGKSAASEPEFLSLHLDARNAKSTFEVSTDPEATNKPPKF